MTWIRLESERYPPPAPTTEDQPIIDAEYRRHPRVSGACAVALARPPCGAQAGPKSGLDAGLKSRLRSSFASIFDAGAVLDDPGAPDHPALAGC